jgi:hypothetical protein
LALDFRHSFFHLLQVKSHSFLVDRQHKVDISVT